MAKVLSTDESAFKAPYSIRDMTRHYGLTARTVRYYETQGLLSPARQGGHRLYSERDRVRLELIQLGKRLGFSLEECRQILDLYHPATGQRTQLLLVLEKIEARKAALAQQRRDIDHLEQALLAAEQRFRNALHDVESEQNG